MICPHCTTGIHQSWSAYSFVRSATRLPFEYRSMICPECRKIILQWGEPDGEYPVARWKYLVPDGATRKPIPPEVPPHIAEDYLEACKVLVLSPKASAALSRRCLQNILRSKGYKNKDLFKEIEALLNDTDPANAIPASLRFTVDSIRNFGNFSAHPITDVSTTQIIDVEPDEAEWCLEILEEAFQHFYVRPADIARRKAALDLKLIAAGKPTSQGAIPTPQNGPVLP